MTTRGTVRFYLRHALACIAMMLAGAAFANDAEIIMIVGRGEARDNAQADWKAAAVQQKLKAGSYVRTLEASQMALLLRDQTQVRLNQQSVLQIKGVAVSGEGTSLELSKGRLWAQAKQTFAGFFRSSPLQVNTATATIGIRGTDWELTTDDSGRTTVTVLSGQVDMANEFGRVAVGPNEQATVVAGQAPVKSLLSDARDRVQWVTAYRPAPRRWVPAVPASLADAVRAIESGDYATALPVLERQGKASGEAALLLADLYLFLGRVNEATQQLAPLAREAADPMATALMARGLTIAGRMEESRRLLVSGIGRHPGHREIALALADLARLEGDGEAALRHFTAVAGTHPQSHEAWFGVGRVQAEKENVREARSALDEALRLAPEAPGYPGERATLEALAGDFKAARAAFAEALRRQPDDYLAWTGLGILQLKTGQPEAALESFLKAGVIEPRFARAQLYVGVAYYQLENRRRAIESVQKAAELDPKDPLPWVMLGLIHGDAQELGAAIAAARGAQERMPYLKSLNQVLNNQKGSANVGSALAAQGMDEWARAAAIGADNPYWAGSALFRADRSTDGFNKNSELYKGFLLDPTVFGASNRSSSLVPVPGHYGSVGYLGKSGDTRDNLYQLTLNGMSTAVVPFAYSLLGDRHDTRAREGGIDGQTATLGVGVRPMHELGVFYFGTDTREDVRFNQAPRNDVAVLTDDRMRQTVTRQDLGIGVRLAPTSQVLAKAGDSRQTTRLAGAVRNVPLQTTLDASLAPLAPFNPNGTIDRYNVRVEETDLQLRHVFDVGADWRIAWGYEDRDERRSLDFVSRYNNTLFPANPLQITMMPTLSFDSTDAYLAARRKFGDSAELELDVYRQRFDLAGVTRQSNVLVGLGALGAVPDVVEAAAFRETNHRAGVRVSPLAGQQLRAIYQRWRRPVGIGSLGETDTLGIPLEDRLVASGGLLKRTRLQYDWMLGQQSFLQAFADHRRITNLQSVVARNFQIFGVSELDALITRKPVFGDVYDDLERTPSFAAGTVRSAGLAGNWLLRPELSMAARYTHNTSLNTSPANGGRRVPYIARHVANVSMFWQASGRWLLGPTATWRSQRFRDEANTQVLDAGWNLGLKTYWETEDKRWSVEAALTQIADRNAAIEERTRFNLNSVFRF